MKTTKSTDLIEVFTTNETAEMLKFSPRKIRLMIEAGEIRPCKIGRSVRFTKAEILRVLETTMVSK